MIIAYGWYNKRFFGTTWTKMTGVTQAKVGNVPPMILLVSNFITAVVLAITIAISSTYFKSDSAITALLTGFVVWLGFSATTLAQHNGFELKPARLTILNNTYRLVLYLAMAFVIYLV